MSGTGVGRGRGWLNLNKSQNSANVNFSSTSPGLPTINHLKLTQNVNILNEEEFNDVEEFTDIINIIKQLSLHDDGIKFNQKVKHLIEVWTSFSKDGEDVERSFNAIYQACLNDADLASKLVFMIASRAFISQEVHEQNIRLMFLRKLQFTFEGSKQMQKNNPAAFQNGVHMFGEFYNKARLANGQQLAFMANPFLSYLSMLLESTNSQDFKLFTIQLNLNGSSARNECPEKVIEIMNNVRLMLTLDKKLSKECKLWLLLSIDLANSKFGPIPSELLRFYQLQLGDASVATFQEKHNVLNVQTTHNNESLNSYQSNVKVLQVSCPLESGIDSTSSSTDYMLHSFNNNEQQSDSSQSGSSTRKTENTNKHGRPILGAGAGRYTKRNSNDDSNLNWREKDKEYAQGGWHKPRVENWNDKKNSPKTNKSWEHDDRFETDYS